MNEHSFEGDVILNGVSQGNEVIVHASENTMSVSTKASRKTLHFIFFNLWMITGMNAESMNEGGECYLRGKRVATYMEGPLGHPGDGEFDRRQIEEITLQFKYCSQFLLISLFGTTKVGFNEGLNGISTKPLKPWKFEIWFQVNKSNLKEFLRMSDSGWSFFEKKLAECDAHPIPPDWPKSGASR